MLQNITPRGEADFDLYPYVPSATAAYAFVTMFGVGGLVHLICIIPYRAWFFIPFVLGCAGKYIASTCSTGLSLTIKPQAKLEDTTVEHGRTTTSAKGARTSFN